MFVLQFLPLLLAAYGAYEKGKTKAPGISPGAEGPGFGALTEALGESGPQPKGKKAPVNPNVQKNIDSLRALGIKNIQLGPGAGAIGDMAARIPLPGRGAVGGLGAPAQGVKESISPPGSLPRPIKGKDVRGKIDQGLGPSIFEALGQKKPDITTAQVTAQKLDRRPTEEFDAGVSGLEALGMAPTPLDLEAVGTAPKAPKDALFQAAANQPNFPPFAPRRGAADLLGGMNSPEGIAKMAQDMIQNNKGFDIPPEMLAKLQDSTGGSSYESKGWQENAMMGAQLGAAIGQMIMQNQTRAPGLPGSRTGPRLGQFSTLAEKFMKR